MPELDRLTAASDWNELEFLEREATPEPVMKRGIQMHLEGLSLVDTTCVGVVGCPAPSNAFSVNAKAFHRIL